MRGFRKLVVLGILLVTLLIVIDTIDAGKKQSKKLEESSNLNEREAVKNTKYNKPKKAGWSKPGKFKKPNIYKQENENVNKDFIEDPMLESKKYKAKKGTKYTTKGTYAEEGARPKITKTYQKVKKYKVVQDEPAKKTTASKIKPKKVKPLNEKETIAEEVFPKPQKKNTQKRATKEKENIEEIVNEEMNMLNDGETISGEDENVANNPKRKKYKLVEVVLEEDKEENVEGNETIIEVGSEEDDELTGVHRTESEEVIETYKTTQTVKLPKIKKDSSKTIIHDEEETDEYYSNITDESPEPTYHEERSVIIEEDLPPEFITPETSGSCRPIPHDPNRKGPKKVTFYVIEEEVNGEIKKYVQEEEDGVTMCEIADLLGQKYGVESKTEE